MLERDKLERSPSNTLLNPLRIRDYSLSGSIAAAIGDPYTSLIPAVAAIFLQNSRFYFG